MFENIINEAYSGNFSFAILIVNIMQLIVGIINLIILLIKRK